MGSGNARAAIGLGVAVVLLVVAVLGVSWWLRSRGAAAPVPGEERCVATAAGGSVAVDLDQAHLTSIVVGLSVRRNLLPRAASIAMATVYQETGIRNLDHGDRDSVGLFQQRPSQGWGTEHQLMDPYYAANKFYDALLKIKNWQTDDVNDVAQKVQRSGHPEAYRDHEADGRVLASTLTGESPAGFTCLERQGTKGDPAALLAGLKNTFGKISASSQGHVVRVRAPSVRLAWAYASYAVANSKTYGLVTADVVGRRWQTQQLTLPAWTKHQTPVSDTVVTLSLR